jgi:DNA-binding NarL/FixJ family response regulator
MIATTEKATGSSAVSNSTQPAAPAPERPRVRVWLTDDNLGFRNSLAHLLDRSGEFDCEQQFDSAETLLQGLAAGPAPDVILLDVEMGGMTGVDALRPIRALAPNVRVLIVTSFFDPMYESRASRDGASAFLLKAYAPQNLTAEIYRALASPVHLAELRSAADGGTAKSGTKHITNGNELPTMAAGRALITRLTLWMISVATALFGHGPLQRPAATPD